MSAKTDKRRRAKDTIVGRLRAADPFELIRWLARSQPDPRKALAELVQNSIDAGARRITISRLRERGVSALHVRDDGEGVIPELERSEALMYIATHIGHSRKRNLTPEQRRELMMQGKYGIGLLGFWAIGQVLEMRSHVPEQPPHVLRMFEDSPRYEIERLRSRLTLGERITEVVIHALHRPAFLSLSARRIVDYLAAELRGQLLARDVTVLVHDRIARGRAPKVLEVQPTRFSGQRLPLPEEVAVAGHGPIRVELYLVPAAEAGRAAVSISCGGTVVYDAITQFEVADFNHAPWTDARVSGLIEYADFQVPPGSRRGVMPDRAALAFAETLRSVEPSITAQLEAADVRSAAALDADLLRQLARAFRDLPRLAPEYDLFAVRGTGNDSAVGDNGRAARSGPAEAGATVVDGATISAARPDMDSNSAEEDEPPSLLPAGPLAALQIVPARTQVERLGQRRLSAIPRDALGTRIRRPLGVRWTADSSLVAVSPADGSVTTVSAGAEIGTAAIRAVAVDGAVSAAGESVVEVVDVLLGSEGPRPGIPEPAFIDEPAGAWRSRMRAGIWEVNNGHPDFLVASTTARRKLRYLAALLSKEIVLHSFPSPQLGPALERLVGVLTITERQLDSSGGTGRGR
jgi:hypothetical protein